MPIECRLCTCRSCHTTRTRVASLYSLIKYLKTCILKKSSWYFFWWDKKWRNFLIKYEIFWNTYNTNFIINMMYYNIKSYYGTRRNIILPRNTITYPAGIVLWMDSSNKVKGLRRLLANNWPKKLITRISETRRGEGAEDDAKQARKSSAWPEASPWVTLNPVVTWAESAGASPGRVPITTC